MPLLTGKISNVEASSADAPRLPSFNQCLKKLHAQMRNLLDEGSFSDLKIVCQGVEFRVHRSILLPRSSFFRACCQFKEGEEGIIVLDDDNPQAVRMALTEIYTHKPFTVKIHFATEETATLQTLLETWKVADKYEIPSLTFQCLCFISSAEGLQLLKQRSGDAWITDLLTALTESKGITMNTEHNSDMRKELKNILLQTKKLGQMTGDEEEVLLKDPETAVELLKHVTTSTTGSSVQPQVHVKSKQVDKPSVKRRVPTSEEDSNQLLSAQAQAGDWSASQEVGW